MPATETNSDPTFGVTDLIKLLDKLDPEAAEYVREMAEKPGACLEHPTTLQRICCADVLYDMFYWKGHSNGHEYWLNVTRKVSDYEVSWFGLSGDFVAHRFVED